jgi:3-keto-5-aminohexanoate cleavage enzyme
MSFDRPIILTVAPNGAYKRRHDHDALPLNAAELARDARACVAAGAAMMHLHVREADGRHSLDPTLYRQALQAIRAEVGDALVLQVTSEAAGVYGPSEQVQAMRALRPEAMSVALRELERPGLTSEDVADFFAWLAGEGVMTQVILYDAVDLQRWRALRTSGAVPAAPWSLLFVLGRYREGQVAEPQDLLPFLSAHTGAEPWSVCAFGRGELACIIAAASFGGHARVGFENNIQLADGALAANNAALVRQAAIACRALGRPLATANEVRALFGR